MDKRIQEMIAGYVDGELSASDRHTFEEELQGNPELQTELEEFRELKEVTGMMRYADLPDEVWETYWQSLYRKLERGMGWILFSIGAIILGCYGFFELVKQIYFDPEIPVLVKIGLGTLGTGLVALTVSAGRQRIFAFRRDRYKEVMK